MPVDPYDGIVSEHDIVRALARRGAAVLTEPVTAIHTSEVHTVEPDAPWRRSSG